MFLLITTNIDKSNILAIHYNIIDGIPSYHIQYCLPQYSYKIDILIEMFSSTQYQNNELLDA